MCEYSYCDFLLLFTASVPLFKTWTQASETRKNLYDKKSDV